MTKTYYNGTSGTAKVGAVDYAITGYKVSTETSEHEVTTVQDGGYYTMIPGKLKATATIDLYYQLEVHGASPSPIKEGTTGTFTLERYSGDTTPFSGTGYIVKCDIDHAFDDVMKATLNVTFSGTYTWFSE